ncbi:MAG TPA: hypothetical protein VEF04_03250 [Blastocatellia bacterium]|nr:hypothetical protein [Blastocatellia bacterium]
MTATFAESIELLLGHLPPTLATSETILSLQTAARFLAPIPRGGFECRLQAQAFQVDLQQQILSSHDEPAILAEHIKALSAQVAVPIHPTWHRLREFCMEWSDESSELHQSVPEIWLELDLTSLTAQMPVPSIFVGLKSENLSKGEARAIIKRAYHLLQGKPLFTSLERNLSRCFQAYDEGAIVSHIGLMLPRRTDTLRVNIKRLQADHITSYLKQLGWIGSQDKLDLLIAQCVNLVRNLTVCVEVGTALNQQIGLECFFEEAPKGLESWRLFLAQLVEQKLCTPEKRDALLAWPGVINPTNALAPWPGHLIAAALQRTDQFSFFTRLLHHLKLTYNEGHALTAKAYFGAIHEWDSGPQMNYESAKPVIHQATSQTAPLVRRVNCQTDNKLETAIAKAATYLLSMRKPSGWWQDYPDFWGGPSDEWVSAYVSYVLAGLAAERVRRAVWWSWLLLSQSRPNTVGLGWGKQAPTDADSTGWWLLLARALGQENSEQFTKFTQFVSNHISDTGGVVCYLEQNYFQDSTTEKLAEIRGWFDEHLCVTAAISHISEFADLCRSRLRQTQCVNGNWNGYWWSDDEYTTVLASEALRLSDMEGDHERVRAAVQWANQRVNADGAVYSSAHGGASAFAAAGCAQLLSLNHDQQSQTTLDRALHWLIEAQQPDGSWNASAWIRVPTLSDPDYVILDHNRLLTTATVLKAMRAIKVRQRML